MPIGAEDVAVDLSREFDEPLGIDERADVDVLSIAFRWVVETVTHQCLLETVQIAFDVVELLWVELIRIETLQSGDIPYRGAPVVLAAVILVFSDNVAAGNLVWVRGVEIQILDRDAIAAPFDLLHEQVDALIGIIPQSIAVSALNKQFTDVIKP